MFFDTLDPFRLDVARYDCREHTSQVGSELLVAGADLFKQRKGVFNDGKLQSILAAPKTGVRECELAIPLSRIRAIVPGVQSIRVLAVNDETFDWVPDSGFLEYRVAER